MDKLGYQPGLTWLERHSPEFGQALMDLSRVRNYAVGEAVWMIGDETQCMMGVVEGCVSIGWTTPGEDVDSFHLMWPGDWLGETPLICGGGGYTTMIEAAVDSRIALVPYSGMRMLLQERPEWWRAIAELSNDHAIICGDTVLDMMLRDPAVRCVATILRMAGVRFRYNRVPRSRLVPLTQQRIAALTNLSRNAVGAILKDLRDRGLIAIHYGGIDLLDVDGLCDLVRADPDETRFSARSRVLQR